MLYNLLPFLIISPPLFYGLFSLYCARDFFSRSHRVDRSSPPVTILKPVKGLDPESFANFASFCRQDYPRFQIVFVAASPNDPVIKVIRDLITQYPDVDMELVIDDRIYGANYKVCNLINAYHRAKYDILIVCDCDILVDPLYLRQVIAPFADPAVGLVTSLYRSTKVRGFATALEAMGLSSEMVPNVMVAMKLEGLSFAMGATMALRREALLKIGGFHALVDYLADDYQLGQMVRRAGYKLRLSRHYVESVMKRESLKEIVSRQLRWARTMRASRPAGFFASGITQTVPLALFALIASGPSAAGGWAVLLLTSVRIVSAVTFSRFYVRDAILPRFLWLLPLRDILSSMTWALSFLGNRVVWRGALFRILPGGKIIEVKKKLPESNPGTRSFHPGFTDGN
ncbi:MAG: bacteriohopanetetrol glucosamine biosynthesis glycosyltransferase HpnI [Deltaproteobacteria bacterium]